MSMNSYCSNAGLLLLVVLDDTLANQYSVVIWLLVDFVCVHIMVVRIPIRGNPIVVKVVIGVYAIIPFWNEVLHLSRLAWGVHGEASLGWLQASYAAQLTLQVRWPFLMLISAERFGVAFD